MKRLLASILTLALLFSCVPLSAVAAEDAVTFSPSVSPGTTEGVTTVETAIPGMVLSIGADTWSQGAVDIDITSASGVTYTGYLTGKANPKPEEGTGTFFSFTFDDSVKTGSLEVMYRLNAGKAFYILDNGEAMPGYDGMKLDVAADTSTTIIVQGGHTYTIYAKGSKLRFYGCTFQNIDPVEVFAQEIARFPFDRIRGLNADIDHVDEDLALVDSYESQFGSCDVSWRSDNAAVIDTDGTVNCQKTEAQIALTGHFSVQENRDFAADVVFTLTVLADPDDASAVQTAADALTLGELSAVKRNLTLPSHGKRGTSVTWKSSDESVVGSDGKVYPLSNTDQAAVLTATITRGEASTTKDFPITVAGIVPVVVDAWSYQNAQGQVRFSSKEAVALRAVNLTCNLPNPGRGDTLTFTVTGPDGKEKQTAKLSVTEVFANVPVGKSVAVTPELAVADGDTVTLTATDAAGKNYMAPVRLERTEAETPTVYVVGDSTASVYGDDRYPRKGWAQMLEGYFDGVTVVDLALSGRSSRSFKNEANYETLKTSLRPGDYLLIQFGHNDNKADAYADPTQDRFTQDSFQQSMLEYVELAWERGAHPILATSISRRKLSDESLEAYVNATRELADALSVPCVDLYAATNGWINQVGVDEAQDMFNCVKPHDSRFITYPAFTGSEFYEKGSTDDTHLNLYGADLIAQWAADIMVELGVPLAEKRSGRTAPTLPSFTQATEAPALSFQDTAPTDWFYPYVQAVCARGLFTGAGDGQFQPDTTTSRAMMATILWRMAGEPTPDYLTPFSDVETGNWYMDAVRWAKQSGVVNGYDDGSFGPDDSITREQLALMLYRFAQIQGVADDAGPDVSLSFDDGDTVSPWAVEAVRWCVAKGLLTGKPGQADDSNTFGLRFDPQGPATRAETAAVTARLALLLEDPWTFLHV